MKIPPAPPPVCWPSARLAGVRVTLACAILTLAGLAQSTAAASSDPFGTEKLYPGRPGIRGEPATRDICERGLPNAPLTLLDVVDQALCRNLQTREVWATARARAAEIGIVRASYLPSVAANGSLSRSQESGSGLPSSGSTLARADVTMSWLLYDFGARDANLENARQLLAAASATQDNTVQSVFFAALQAFYQVHARQASLNAAIDSERSSKEALRAAAVRYAVGTATPSDRLQAQTNYSQAVLERIRAEGDLQTARGVLANVLAISAEQPVPLAAILQPPPDETYAADIGALVTEASRRRPDLLAAEAEVRAAAASIDAARASGRPTISFSASVGMQDSSNLAPTRSGTIGLNLNVPLFSGHAPAYRVRAAEARAEAQAAVRDRLRLQVSLDVWRNYQALLTAIQSARTSTDVLASAEMAERVALGRYKAGVGNILDLLSAQASLAKARQQNVQASFDWNVARAALAQSTGGLDIGLLTTMNESHLDPLPPSGSSPR